eukprot:162474_1
MNQIFEVNVVNNLEHESIFVQIRSDLNYNKRLKQHTLPYQHANPRITNKNVHKGNIMNSHMNINHHQQATLSGLSDINSTTTTPVGQYQRYINQHRHTYMNMGTADRTNKINVITKEEKEANIVEKKEIGNSSTEVYPGFVRISAFQSLPMPVVINNKSFGQNANSY